MMRFVPLGTLPRDVAFSKGAQDFEVKKGNYYYVPAFRDARIYRNDPEVPVEFYSSKVKNFGDFDLIAQTHDQALDFMTTLSALMASDAGKADSGVLESAQELLENLNRYTDSIKEAEESLKQRDHIKTRKMQSNCRQMMAR